MIQFRKFIPFLLFLMITQGVFSSDYQLSLKEAVDTAVQNNLSLKSAQVDLEAKKRDKNFSWNQFLPSFSFTPTIARDLFPKETPVAIPENSAALGLNFQLALNPGAFINVTALISEYKSGLITYEDTVNKLVRDVKKNYYNLILLRDYITILEGNVAIAKSRYEQALFNFKNGFIPQIQLLQVQAVYESLSPQLINSRNLYQTSLLKFKIDLGLNFEDTIVLTESASEIPVLDLNPEELVSVGLSQRLDLQSITAAMDTLRKSRQSLLAGSLSPTFVLGVNYNAVRLLYNKEDEPDPNDFKESGSFTFSISIPISSYIYGSSSIMKAKALEDSLKKLDIQLENSLRLCEMEIRMNIMNLNKSYQTLKALEFSANLAEQVYAQSSEGYKSGLTEVLDLEDAEMKLLQARVNLLEEKIKYLNTIADLEYSINKPLTDSVSVQ